MKTEIPSSAQKRRQASHSPVIVIPPALRPAEASAARDLS